MDALERVCNSADNQVAVHRMSYGTVTIELHTQHTYVDCDLGALETPKAQLDEYDFLSELGV